MNARFFAGKNTDNMGRRKRKEGGVDVLLNSPWWLSIVVGVLAYVFLRWIVPSAFASSPLLAALSLTSQSIAWLALPTFGLIAFISFVSKRKALPAPILPRAAPFKKTVTRPRPIDKDEWEAFKATSAPTNSITPLPGAPSFSLESLRSLEWKRFEMLCAKYYEIVGFKSVTLASGPDGGIDVKLYKLDPDHPIAIVQCKAWASKPVGVKEIRELLGVMVHEKVSRGIFITSGVYSKDAASFGETNPIHLLDGQAFIERILQLDISKQNELYAFAFTGDYRTPTCASCGIKMVQREGKERPFWGCPNYPRCRSTFAIKNAASS
jgi:restriction system protein